ncbi:hypothetical protein [Chryseobacterium bernardetii]|uniref:hypothetical protein n=1 Tax=Chryseobacterium bernardetii TaxID=1241978 RepID=UPI000F50EBAE|nr:hypothetical protein [Chryseobacterium bernardetii]AZB35831.1 hypothetical protein EG351_21095 [Chryseobacterium bernardetii]
MKTDKILPYSQLFYYLLTAVWPFVHLESFFAVTGPKTDIWLVKTVSLLLFPYTFLILYIMHVRYSPLITVTIILGCLGLAGIDLYYYLKGVIRWVYLIDFILELIFVMYWIFYIKMNTKK